jgi:hypothetical protein
MSGPGFLDEARQRASFFDGMEHDAHGVGTTGRTWQPNVHR